MSDQSVALPECTIRGQSVLRERRSKHRQESTSTYQRSIHRRVTIETESKTESYPEIHVLSGPRAEENIEDGVEKINESLSECEKRVKENETLY